MIVFGLFGSPEVSSSEAIDEGSAQQMVARVCGSCHGLKVDNQCLTEECARYKTRHTDGRDWERTIKLMRAMNCSISPSEEETILAYLNRHFPGSEYPVSWKHVGTTPVGWNVVTLRAFREFLFSGVEGGGRIYRSRTGEDWEEVLNTKKISVYGLTVFKDALFAGTDQKLAEVWMTRDGHTWENTATLPENEVGISAMGVFKNKLYAGTRRTAIYESEDGVNWTYLSQIDDRFAYFRFLISFKDFLYAGFEPGGGVYRSADGRKWERVSGVFPSHNGVRGVGVFNNELFVGMHSPPQIWKTADGLTWQKVFDPTEGKGKGYIASMAAWDGHLYTGVNLHAPEPSDVFRTADGMTWEEAGELTPYTIEAMEVFQGDLFAGVLLPSGAWIYRSTKGP